MTATILDDRERDADRKARRREQARHDRAVRRAHGRCQACGVTCAPGSRSRCLVCLERDRRARRQREGKTTVRPNGRGRKMLGSWGDRNRAYERDEVMAAALIDRLLHHCHVVNIRGNSYRMREHTDLLRAISPRAHDARASKPKRRPRREGSTT